MHSQNRTQTSRRNQQKLKSRFTKLGDNRMPTPAEYMSQVIRIHCSDIVSNLIGDNADKLKPVVTTQKLFNGNSDSTS